MKKPLKKTLSLFIVVCFICSLSACGTTPCQHNYVGTTTKEATCGEMGVKTYTCTACGNSYAEDIAKLTTHSYTSAVTKEATCGEMGVRTYTCNTCGNSYTEDIASTGNHHFTSSITKQPNCKDNGIETYICIACGETHNKYIDKTNEHSYVCTVTKKATSEEAGIKTYTCSICSKSYTDSFLLSKVTYSGLPSIFSLYNGLNRLAGNIQCSVNYCEISQDNILTKVGLKIELKLYDSSQTSVLFSGGTGYFILKVAYVNENDQTITKTTKSINLPTMTQPGIKYIEMNMSLALPLGPTYQVYTTSNA